MQQLLAANGLLKLYHPKAIIAALRKDTKAYSLRAPWLDDLIKEEQMKVDATKDIPIIVQEPKATTQAIAEKPRESFSSKKSTLNRLRELDE